MPLVEESPVNGAAAWTGILRLAVTTPGPCEADRGDDMRLEADSNTSEAFESIEELRVLFASFDEIVRM